jgi:hypothetical protein
VLWFIVLILGLASGILTIQRKHFIPAIIGVFVVLISSFVILMHFVDVYYGNLFPSLLLSSNVVILSSLGAILTVKSKSEFT